MTAHDNTTHEMHALEARIIACRACPLANGRTHAVPGEGDYNAVVMFVGEGPGFEEDRQGRPFVGASGRFLTRYCKPMASAAKTSTSPTS